MATVVSAVFLKIKLAALTFIYSSVELRSNRLEGMMNSGKFANGITDKCTCEVNIEVDST